MTVGSFPRSGEGILFIAEQSRASGIVKKVHEVEFDPGTLMACGMMFCRPE